jgi:hypothetical protein
MGETYLGQNFLKDSTVRHWIADRVAKLYRELNAQSLLEI